MIGRIGRPDLQCSAQHLGDTHVVAFTEPLLDRLSPRVTFETLVLFGGGERFEFSRFEPPRLSGVVTMYSLGPQLIAIALDPLNINPAATDDRPEAASAGRVFQIAANRRIDSSGEYTLPVKLDQMPRPRRTETIETPR